MLLGFHLLVQDLTKYFSQLQAQAAGKWVCKIYILTCQKHFHIDS